MRQLECMQLQRSWELLQADAKSTEHPFAHILNRALAHQSLHQISTAPALVERLYKAHDHLRHGPSYFLSLDMYAWRVSGRRMPADNDLKSAHSQVLNAARSPR